MAPVEKLLKDEELEERACTKASYNTKQVEIMLDRFMEYENEDSFENSISIVLKRAEAVTRELETVEFRKENMLAASIALYKAQQVVKAITDMLKDKKGLVREIAIADAMQKAKSTLVAVKEIRTHKNDVD